jgi:hypothetical protein
VAGIRIGVHWSVLVIVLVLALGLAGRFPDTYAGRPSWQYWITGLLGAVVFLLSLLAHEQRPGRGHGHQLRHQPDHLLAGLRLVAPPGLLNLVPDPPRHEGEAGQAALVRTGVPAGRTGRVHRRLSHGRAGTPAA